jgi:hypothetical protein
VHSRVFAALIPRTSSFLSGTRQRIRGKLGTYARRQEVYPWSGKT